MQNQTNIDFVDNPQAKGNWDEYVAAGLPADIGSFHLCITIHAIAKSGLVSIMREQNSFTEALLRGKYDPHIITHFLQYLIVRGMVVRLVEEDNYRLTEYGRRCLSPVSLAQIGFYVEAYAPVLMQMTDLLIDKKKYGKEVVRDGTALGEHCATLFTIFHTEIILKIMKEKGISSILDLGCGGGAMLVDACLNEPALRGFGLDISPGAIDFANTRCKSAKLEDRLSFAVGDAFDPDTWPAYGSIDAIAAVGALHEHFRDGERAVIDLLNFFATLMQEGRTKYFILGEPELYYDTEENDPDLFLVHIFTAQGFPRRREAWMKIIASSRLTCETVYTRKGIGPRFCFYVLTLK